MEKNVFNVLIYECNSNTFESYDILRYLEREYNKEKTKPTNLEEWIDKELMYQFWSRCQYELCLTPWPPAPNIIKKIDIYYQCKMNLKTIIKLFKENEGLS